MSTAHSPVLLRADNFAPPARTPWGGTRIARDYKQRWLAAGSEDALIGESWEISVEPDFPARLEDGTLLSEHIASAPEAWLGDEYRRGRSGTALLVKLIDTFEPLSLQIHPSDDYAGLSPDESGKPESWYVVAREQGAGLFLGFRAGTREQDVRDALLGKGSMRELLHFVPVEPGDFFVIDAGMPHAIGAGLTLVEPQHVMPGRRGVTYRYWDWDRRYDAVGRPSAEGEPRPLHVEHALRVTDWSRFEHDDFIDKIRVRSAPCSLDEPPRLLALAGPGGLPSEWLQVARLSGTGRIALPSSARFTGITVLEGSVSVGALVAERGRSMAIPAQRSECELVLERAHAIVSSVA